MLNPILNPDNLDVIYIKDFKIYDKEGYLITDGDLDPIPIKMKKYIFFKNAEVTSEGTDSNYTLFNITFDLVPEVLIKLNDTIKLKIFTKCFI